MTSNTYRLPAAAPAAWRHTVLRWPWPLFAVLLVQAYFTVRLVGVGYASDDEGRYIWAGHQLIYELFHGGGSPYFETYYSGAPWLYPPLAAIADRVGGLAAVRLM